MQGTSIQDYQAFIQLSREVRGLELQRVQRAGAVENADQYRFLIAPTCPPSTSIRFQGGLLWWPMYSYYACPFFCPSYTVDLADTDKVSVSFTFTHAYWYKATLIGVDQDIWPDVLSYPTVPPDDTIYLRGYTQEFETATEAEAYSRDLIGQQATFYSHNMGAIILRNNGNTVDYNQVMPIDPINRGRSYIFGKKRYGWELA